VESLSRSTLQQIVSSSSLGIVVVEARDPHLRIAYANPAYEDMSGYTAAELDGASWKSLFAEEAESDALCELRRAIGCGEPCDVTLPFFRKDGSSWSSRLSVRPLGDRHGDPRYFLCQHDSPVRASAQIETGLLKRALGQARKKLVTVDRTDPVTGLLSFDHFRSQLRRDLSIARRQQRPITLLLFEVVELDVYRQTFGSNAADSCLRMIGAQIAGTFRRAGDLCARYGESMVITAVPGQEVAQVGLLAKRVAEKIRNLGLHNPRAKSGKYVTVRSSVTPADPAVDDDIDWLLDRSRARLDGEATENLQRTAVS
jgi:PAS domain S-box-containing protein/diguanylate cyclase (GGDEF)-like protein